MGSGGCVEPPLESSMIGRERSQISGARSGCGHARSGCGCLEPQGYDRGVMQVVLQMQPQGLMPVRLQRRCER